MNGKENRRGKSQILITNILFGIVLINIFILSKLLTFKAPFIYGIYTGIIFVAVVFNITAVRGLKNRAYAPDERSKMIIQKSGFLSFAIVYSLTIILTILSRSVQFHIQLPIEKFLFWATFFQMTIFGLLVFFFSRRY